MVKIRAFAPKKGVYIMKKNLFRKIIPLAVAAAMLAGLAACNINLPFNLPFGGGGRSVDHIPFEGVDFSDYIELGEYRGVSVAFENVSEAAVLATAKGYFADDFAADDSKTVVAEGDDIIMDYDGSVDGVSQQGMKDEGHVMAVVGAQTFIPGFEDQIIGKAVGEEFEVRVTFPDDYWSEDLAGKEAVFICIVHEIGEIPITGEGVQELTGGQFTTVDELLEVIQEDMEHSIAQHNMELAFQTAFDNATVLGIPQGEWDYYMEMLLEDLNSFAEQSGMSAEELLQAEGFESIEDYWEQDIEPQLKRELFIFAVAEAEGIELGGDDFDDVLNMIRMQSGDMSMTEQEIYENVVGRGDIIRYLMSGKVEELIFEQAVDANA